MQARSRLLTLSTCLSACVLAFVSGCTLDDPDADDPTITVDPSDPLAGSDTSTIPDETEFSQTFVWFDADGTQHVREPEIITAAVERHENALRLAIATGIDPISLKDATVDPSCPYNALWIYSGVNRTGDRLCVLGADFGPSGLSLSSIPRTICFYVDGAPTCFPTNWELTSGSVWPGESAGALGSDDYAFGWWQSWNAWGAWFSFSVPYPETAIHLSLEERANGIYWPYWP